MNKETNYKDEYMEIGEVVDILPNPKELAKMARTERATLTLSKSTLDYFRDAAKKEQVAYTALIRHALDEYVRLH